MEISDIVRIASELRGKVANVQADAEHARVEGEAGGGLVRVVMNGRHEVLQVHIDPKAMVPSEVALVEDLVRAAANQASLKVSELLKERMANVARQLGVDASMLGGMPGL